jgi:hypothetical protein
MSTTKLTNAKRQQLIVQALASVRVEGLEPSMATKQRLAHYAQGQISVTELQEQTLAEVKQSILH